MEIEIGTLRLERKDPNGGKALRNWVEMMILPGLSGRILPVDLAVARVCATFQGPKSGPDRNALLAATAVVHAMTVVARNVADFKVPDVKVLNLWTT
jgi:toxin FitB